MSAYAFKMNNAFFFLSEPGETIIEAEGLYSFPGFSPTRPYGAQTGNKVEVNPLNENKNKTTVYCKSNH